MGENSKTDISDTYYKFLINIQSKISIMQAVIWSSESGHENGPESFHHQGVFTGFPELSSTVCLSFPIYHTKAFEKILACMAVYT